METDRPAREVPVRTAGEESARRSAAELRRFLVLEGGKASQVAAALGVSERTIRRWDRQCALEGGLWTPRGRMPERSAPQMRNRVVHALELLGRRASGRWLVGLFDDMARGEVLDIETRYWTWRARRYPEMLGELRWTFPGAVWAMDHAMPPGPVDGLYRAIFALRDLASGYQILWEPVEDVGSEAVLTCLRRCFERCGPPLVLKSDSGSAFISHALAEFLRAWGVRQILSPPRRPQYNGAAEASIRWMKVRTELEAEAEGRAAAWRREDMDRARLRANSAVRRSAGSAAEVWLARRPLGDDLRAAFAETAAREEQAVLEERGLPADRRLPALLERSVRRDALRRALVAHGLLQL